MPIIGNLHESLGEEIAADEQRYTEPLEETSLPPTLYMGLDGTGIPMRAVELAGRVGKQPDGSAKTREVKLCVPVRDPGSVTYSAAIESAASPDGVERSAFAARVLREAARRRFRDAPRRAIIALRCCHLSGRSEDFRERRHGAIAA